MVKERLQDATKLPIHQVREKPNGTVMVTCDQEMAAGVLDTLENTQETFMAEIEKLRSPRIKITGIYETFSPENLQKEFESKNNLHSEDIQVIHTYLNKRTQLNEAIVQVTPQTHAESMQKKRKGY